MMKNPPSPVLGGGRHNSKATSSIWKLTTVFVLYWHGQGAGRWRAKGALAPAPWEVSALPWFCSCIIDVWISNGGLMVDGLTKLWKNISSMIVLAKNVECLMWICKICLSLTISVIFFVCLPLKSEQPQWRFVVKLCRFHRDCWICVNCCTWYWV